MKEHHSVNYDVVDPLKRYAQELASQTAPFLERLGMNEFSSSRGESSFVWKKNHEPSGLHTTLRYDTSTNTIKASTIEGIGTKNLVADIMEKVNDGHYYNNIGKCSVNAIVNDLITTGARGEVISMFLATGSAKWFGGSKARDYLQGWKEACDEAKITWGGGESQVLEGIIKKNKVVLAGHASGDIKSLNGYMDGKKVKAGHLIFGIESNGIHTNGITNVRSLAKELPRGFATKLPSGQMFGDAILKPTHSYAPLVERILGMNLRPDYIANITGHAFQKVMRLEKDLTYRISKLPEPQEEFQFIQEKTGYTDKKMYETFNMGVGYVMFLDPKIYREDDLASVVEDRFGLKVYNLGKVEEGPRQVILEPKGIVYDKLGVR